MDITDSYNDRAFLSSWTNRIIIINTLVFLYMAWVSGGLTYAEMDVGLFYKMGAKVPVAIAMGDYWRLLTPVFLHFGIIHFAFNNYMLHVIGNQLEETIGSTWFLIIYLASGIAGNLASSVFTVDMGAGASGAIFGLLGVGFFLESSIGKQIERATGKKPKNQVYAMTVLINLGLGFMIPVIDNAAHIGGLICGVVLTTTMVHLRPNRLVRQNKKLGLSILSTAVFLAFFGVYLATNASLVSQRLTQEGDEATDYVRKFQMYSQALELTPDNLELRFKRARILLFAGELQRALTDLRLLADKPEYHDRLKTLVAELKEVGSDLSWDVSTIIEHGQQ